jgi:hypothetical protein
MIWGIGFKLWPYNIALDTSPYIHTCTPDFVPMKSISKSRKTFLHPKGILKVIFSHFMNANFPWLYVNMGTNENFHLNVTNFLPMQGWFITCWWYRQMELAYYPWFVLATSWLHDLIYMHCNMVFLITWAWAVREANWKYCEPVTSAVPGFESQSDPFLVW